MLTLATGIVPAHAQVPCATPDGTLCADDGDPCTTDVCTSGVCVHAGVPNRITCDPVLDAYRRTLGLGALVIEVGGMVGTSLVDEDTKAAVGAALDVVGGDLAVASDALAGRLAIPPPASGETLAQVRARVAWGLLRETPPLVRPVIRALARSAPDLARRARFLYRSTNQLKRELRRLQRVLGVFAR